MLQWQIVVLDQVKGLGNQKKVPINKTWFFKTQKKRNLLWFFYFTLGLKKLT